MTPLERILRLFTILTQGGGSCQDFLIFPDFLVFEQNSWEGEARGKMFLRLIKFYRLFVSNTNALWEHTYQNSSIRREWQWNFNNFVWKVLSWLWCERKDHDFISLTSTIRIHLLLNKKKTNSESTNLGRMVLIFNIGLDLKSRCGRCASLGKIMHSDWWTQCNEIIS